jgi:hypothetical protein
LLPCVTFGLDPTPRANAKNMMLEGARLHTTVAIKRKRRRRFVTAI